MPPPPTHTHTHTSHTGTCTAHACMHILACIGITREHVYRTTRGHGARTCVSPTRYTHARIACTHRRRPLPRTFEEPGRRQQNHRPGQQVLVPRAAVGKPHAQGRFNPSHAGRQGQLGNKPPAVLEVVLTYHALGRSDGVRLRLCRRSFWEHFNPLKELIELGGGFQVVPGDRRCSRRLY